MKKYFEFSKQDYYGLVVVTESENQSLETNIENATKIYVEIIGGDSIEEVLAQGEPQSVSKETAFWKLANAIDVKDMTTDELIKEFNSMENTCILIDGALL